MKFFLGIIKGLFALVVFIGLQQLIELSTKGFCLQKILADDLPYHANWDAPPLYPPEQTAINTILDQPYYLIGAGSECFVFRSADSKTVIKFFKFDKTRPVYFITGLFREDHSRYAGTLSDHWLITAPLIEPLHTIRQRLLGIREFRITRTFSSLKIAYEELKEETGIFYLHLNPTDHFHKKLTIVDRNGYHYQIDLDSTRFLLQHCATPLESHFKQLIEHHELTQARAAIDSLFELILKRCRKGFADRDFINRNIGFIGNQAIEIDIGSFSKDPTMKKPWAYKRELFCATAQLNEWLADHYPELHTYYEARLEALIRSEI